MTVIWQNNQNDEGNIYADESDKENNVTCNLECSDLDNNDFVKEKLFLENSCKCEKIVQ